MNRTQRSIVLLLGLLLVVGGWMVPDPGLADDFEFDFGAEEEYKEFVEEAGMALSYPALDPAGAKGVIGWDVGAGVTFADIPSGEAMDEAFGGDAPNYLPLPKVGFSKGLVFNTDVSAFVSTDPDGDATYVGLAGKWAFIPGGFSTPSVAVRATATRLFGVSEFDLRTVGADLTISQGFGLDIGGFTPYAGVSTVNIKGDEDFDQGVSPGSHSSTEGKYYLGARLDLPVFVDLTVQYDAPFDQDTRLYSLQGTIGF